MAGRPSNLTESQWARLEERLLRGDAVRELCKDFGTSPSAISKRFGKKRNELKSLAEQVASVETAVEGLPMSERLHVRSLADELKAVSFHLATAAKSGAFVAAKLNEAAANQAVQLNTANMDGEDMQRLAKMAALHKTANEASVIARDLLRANKEAEGPPPMDKAELLREIESNLPN